MNHEAKEVSSALLSSWWVLVVFSLSVMSVLNNKFGCTGVILEYELRDKTREMKEIDLLHLTPE